MLKRLKRWSIVLLAIALSVFIAGKIASFCKVPISSKRPAAGGNTQFITVEPNVQLEVIDFGGSGRALILLAGLGHTAHTFAQFATKLTPKYHVYGITRRGFGLSSAPASGYTANRLGADVVAVIEALKLVRPVVVGHSVAGEEMSYVATYHPEMVAGLIYLDAGYEYALYDQVYGSPQMRYLGGAARVLDFLLPAAFESKIIAVMAGQRKFTEIHVPVLAFFADPHDDAARGSEAEKKDFERTDRQANAFQRQVPPAIIIRLPHASHEIYRSNEAAVLSAMDAFIRSLHYRPEPPSVKISSTGSLKSRAILRASGRLGSYFSTSIEFTV